MTRKIRYKEISEAMEKIAKPSSSSSPRPSVGLDKSVGEYYFLDVDQIVPFRNQARKSFDQEALSRLADSIKEHGICQPLTVIRNSCGRYEVVSGERRLKAAKLVGLYRVPCIILKEINYVDAIALIENIHRTDLTPIELGQAFSKLLALSVFENQEHLAKSISLSKGTISEYIKFSELPEEIKNKLKEHNITSRNRLRNVAKILKESGVQEVNRIISGSNDQPRVPILKVFLLGDDIKIQDKGLKNMDVLDKRKLKCALQKVIDEL